MRKLQYKTTSYSLGGKLISNLSTRPVASTYVTRGSIVTPLGIVVAYSEPDKGGYTELTFAHLGVQHRRTWRTTLTERGIATAARRFATDVVAGRASS